MRNILIISLIAFTTMIFSCSEGQKNTKTNGKPQKFSISGKLENGSGRKIFLDKIGTESLVSLDTAIIDDKGEFSFKESTTAPEFFILRTEGEGYINLLLYGHEKVKITGDYNNLREYGVSGSEDSEKIKLLSAETFKVIKRLEEFNEMARDSINSPNYTALRVKSNEEYKLLMESLKNFSVKFINDNQNSLVSLLALYGQVGPQLMVFHPTKDLPVYEKVDSALFASYPDLPVVLSLHEYLTALKAQMAAQETQTSTGFGMGEGVPEIALPSPDGKIIKLSSLKGKIVLLDFWASWCQPCRHENPNLVENYNKYKSKGFEIYQVSLDRTREDWLNGIKQDNLNWTHVSDLKYWDSSVVPLFKIQGIPTNYLLDKDGKIIAANLRGPELGEKLKEIFNY